MAKKKKLTRAAIDLIEEKKPAAAERARANQKKTTSAGSKTASGAASTGKKPTLPASKTKDTSAASSMTAGQLYRTMVEDLIGKSQTYAGYGSEHTQDIANALVKQTITEPDKGDVKSLDWDAMRDMTIANAEIAAGLSKTGLFNSPDYALSSQYSYLPETEYMQELLTQKQMELAASRVQDDYNRAKAAAKTTTDAWLNSEYQKLQNNKDATDHVERMKNWTYYDWLSGDRSTAYDFGEVMNRYNQMDDDTYYEEAARIRKQFESADWASLTDSETRQYESATPGLQSDVDMLQAETERRRRLQEMQTGIRSNPNYTATSTYTAPEYSLDPSWQKGGIDAFIAGAKSMRERYGDKQYFINSASPYMTLDAAGFYSADAANYMNEGLHLLTAQEKADYNAYMAISPEKGDEYLELLRPVLLARNANIEDQYYTTRAGDPLYATIDTAISVPKNVWGTVNTVLGALTGETDPNAAIYAPARQVQATREESSKTFGEMFPTQILGEKAGTIGYNILTSIGDMLFAKGIGGMAGMVTDKAGAAQKVMGWVMASESGTNTYLGDLQEGKDPVYSALHGVANGAIEMWSESGFIDSLFDEKGKFLTRVFKSGASEGLEEIVSEGGQMATDLFGSYLTGNQSEIEQTYKYYEATLGKDKAAMATMQHYAENFAIAGLSGFATGSGTSAVVNTSVEADNRATGKAVQQQGDPEKLLEIAKSMPEDSETRKIAAAIEVGLGKGNKMSLGQLGKMTKTMAGELNQEYADITNKVMDEAIEQRLVELESSPEAAKRNAPAIRKMAFGEKLTAAERAAVAWDDNADQVTRELSREMQESKTPTEGAPATAPEGQRAGQKWVTSMKVAQLDAGGEVLGKQIDMQRAVTTKNVSQTVKDAAARGEAKTRKGKNGKPSGKLTDRLIAFDDGTKTGKGEGEIQRFVEEDGTLKMVIKTGKGDSDIKTVSLDSMTEAEGAGVAGLIESVNDINSNLHSMSAEDANAMLATYTSVGGDVQSFMEGYEKDYLSAYSGMENVRSILPPELSKIAQASGKRAAEADEKKRKERASAYKAVSNPAAGWLGTVNSNAEVRGSGDAEALSGAMEAMTESQRVTAEAAVEFGKAVGLNVVLFESNAKNIRKIQNGSFDQITHTVYLDVNSGAGSGESVQAQKGSGTLGYAIMRTLGHEVTHYLEDASPEMYGQYKAAVKAGLKAAGEDVAQLIRGKIDNALNEGRKLSYAAAEAEVIADASEYMLQDSKFTTQMDDSLRGKVKTFVQNFMQKVKEIFTNLTGGHRESKALRELVDGVYRYTGKLQELWDASLQEVLDKGTEKQGWSHAGTETDETSPMGKHAAPNYGKHAAKDGDEGEYAVYYGKHRAADQTGEGTEMVEEQVETPEQLESVKNSMRDVDVSYDALVSKPDMQLTMLTDDIGTRDRAAIINAGYENAKSRGTEGKSGMPAVYVRDIGRNVHVSKNSLKHGLDRRADAMSTSVQHAGELLENAILINTAAPKKAEATDSYILLSAGKEADGTVIMVEFVVNSFTDEVESFDVMYSMKTKWNQPRQNAELGGEPLRSPDSTISIADLLEYGKDYFADVLSENVMEYFGQERKPTEITNYLRYSTRDLPAEVSVREFISEAGDDVAATIEEKNALQYFRKRLDAYKAATQAVEAAENAWSDAVAEKGSDSIAAAAAQNVVNIRRSQQRRAYNELVTIEETPYVKRVFDWTRQFITETLSGSAEEITQRQAEAESNLAELESQYEALREAGRTQLAAEKKRALEQQQRYARTIKAKVAEGIKERRAEYEAREQKAREYRRIRDEVDKLRRGIGRKVKRLNALRVRETDQKHVPQELQHVADLVMQTFTDSELGRLAFHEAKLLNLGRTYRLLLQSEKDAAYFWDDDIETDIENLKALSEAYTAIRERGAGYPSRLSLEGVELETEILQGVDNIVSNVLNMIDSTNTAFLYGREENFNQFAKKTGEKLLAHKDHKVLKGALGKIQEMLDEGLRTGNTTPIYFFEHLQNQEMLDVFDEIRRGQNYYAQIVAEGKDFVQAAKAKYNYGSWVNNGKLKFETSQKDPKTKKGHVIELTREEAAEIYAIAKREAANKLYQTEHLIHGGFQYKHIAEKGEGKYQQKDTPHQLDKADLEKIENWLTAEQKAYADELVGFLSTTMADYGNAASMDMYGYKKFTEQYYIPFHTVANQRFQRGDEGPQGENAGTGRVKNAGFTKKLQHKANQPLVVQGLTDTVAEHIHKMAAYAAMVQPIENMKRLLNYKVVEADGTTNTVRALIGQKYGKASEDYLTQLLKDMNGATQSDQRAAALTDKLVGAFKRGAVMASASVVLQQPTAMVRAMAYISPKYFSQNPFYRPSKGTWDELMKYSGTAVIKDMGKFDVGMGLTATQYIADENLNMFEAYRRLKAESKFKAGKAAYDRFMNWLTAAPGKADQWTWGLIWKAVKAEQAALHPEMDQSSEAFLNMCGARFDDVIDHTQVYDSVLTRSNLMRSTNAFHKMATSFMSEPTLSLNMLWDAVRGKHTKGERAAIVGGVMASQVLAGALAAVVQAWNDDDDERNWLEKYADRATGNIINNIFVLNMIPYVSDIIGIFQGYDVERMDTAVISDVITYSTRFIDKVAEGKELTLKDWENFAGTWANLTGIPAKNIFREIRRTINAATKTDWSTPNAFGVGQAMLENTWGYGSAKTDYYQRIMTALARGETQLAEDYKAYMLASKGVDADGLTQGIREAYMDAYKRGGIDKDTAIDFLMDNDLVTGETEDKRKQSAFQYVDKWEEGTTNYSAYNTLKDAYKAISFSDIEKAWKELTNNGYSDEQVKTQSRTLLKELVQDGTLTTGQATQLLRKWCSYKKDSDNMDKPKEWVKDKK